MTSEEFRANSELVIDMRKLLETPVMQLALEIMDGPSENPVHTVPDYDVSPQFANIQLGQQTGYVSYGQRLRLLGQHINLPQPEPEATYGDDPQET